MKDKIEQRIELLKQERDNFIKNANTQIAAYNGAIAELERLLTDDDSPVNDAPKE